jgi:hypothetical protein
VMGQPPEVIAKMKAVLETKPAGFFTGALQAKVACPLLPNALRPRLSARSPRGYSSR